MTASSPVTVFPPHVRALVPNLHRFVNVRFSLRFVMVSVPDPNPVEDNSVVDDGSASDSPVMTLSHALADVDIM